MKKLLSLLLVAAMVFSFVACGAQEEPDLETAFTNSKEAFGKIDEAYQLINEYSEDIYEAWYQGVNFKKSYYSDNVDFDDFVDEMNIERKHIEAAVCKLRGTSTFSESSWEYLPNMYNDSVFSACVAVMSEAYVCSGDVEKMELLLTGAMGLMKSLSNKYSDYEHYPALKGYFTNTLAFLDFCKNPEGSFEQVVETFNNYRNNARENFFELNYIFEDSIHGMEKETTEEE